MHKFFLAVLVAVTLLCLVPIAAKAEDIPKGLGHPKSFPAPHWYDPYCCTQKDCEPLPFSAVTIVDEGYRVRYRASLGLLVDLIVPWDKAKPSKDGQHHGCASPVRFFCFYAATGA
jgi:hypothetical protein